MALQWGHGEFAVENQGTVSAPAKQRDIFNGATANSPWRTGTSTITTVNALLSSMGPRRIRRGEPRSQRPSRGGCRVFNGATANSLFFNYSASPDIDSLSIHVQRPND